jgi:hypothetical protein
MIFDIDTPRLEQLVAVKVVGATRPEGRKPTAPALQSHIFDWSCAAAAQKATWQIVDARVIIGNGP